MKKCSLTDVEMDMLTKAREYTRSCFTAGHTYSTILLVSLIEIIKKYADIDTLDTTKRN